jgi:hypothetical protein
VWRPSTYRSIRYALDDRARDSTTAGSRRCGRIGARGVVLRQPQLQSEHWSGGHGVLSPSASGADRVVPHHDGRRPLLLSIAGTEAPQNGFLCPAVAHDVGAADFELERDAPPMPRRGETPPIHRRSIPRGLRAPAPSAEPTGSPPHALGSRRSARSGAASPRPTQLTKVRSMGANAAARGAALRVRGAAKRFGVSALCRSSPRQ